MPFSSGLKMEAEHSSEAVFLNCQALSSIIPDSLLIEKRIYQAAV
jgi:hypothetical protein